MEFPQPQNNEKERLEALKEYKLLSTPTTPDFHNITNLAANVCNMPIAFVSLIYKTNNHLLSCYGISLDKTPRNISFCTRAIQSFDRIYMVNDIHKNEFFKNSSIVKEYKVRFYAGVPLINPEGHALGTLCVYDHIPRKLTNVQCDTLVSLAEQIVSLLELRKKNHLLQDAENELLKRNKQLENFAQVVSHDLKSPLANITSLTRLLREENIGNLSKDSIMYLDYIEESSYTLKGYIDGTLGYYKANKLLEGQKTDIQLQPFFEKIKEMLIIQHAVFKYPTEGIVKNINEAALTQIVLNLVDNALKYNTSDTTRIKIQYESLENFHQFTIQDNGIGIDKTIQGDVFELFKTTGAKDREGKQGTGIGLATVKNLVNKMGGSISLESDIGQGSTFIFTLKK
ncbi:GAF domain-containing sensor histidine kinase [Marixanthomonas ophiurae]|uniref:histidine kinase n=1 Tax=Marixanthomonas ophiurae TaxID=387659 RepID=A0A3E1Q882_9FLAO|nr:GAF domain-containing sensor histidine kinase [Marixanthomonas ophiurae]RFN58343.1 GAF domain-containing protein [Marixanthomonas ophiurae]